MMSHNKKWKSGATARTTRAKRVSKQFMSSKEASVIDEYRVKAVVVEPSLMSKLSGFWSYQVVPVLLLAGSCFCFSITLRWIMH